MGRSQDQQVRALGEERCERVMTRRKATGGRREAQEADWGQGGQESHTDVTWTENPQYKEGVRNQESETGQRRGDIRRDFFCMGTICL